MTLKQLVSSNQQLPWRWYVSGELLKTKRPYGMTEVRTFVQFYPDGDIAVGYMGQLDGSFTFVSKEWFTSVPQLKGAYPNLFASNGELWQK